MEKKLLEAFSNLGKSAITALPKVAVGILLVILALIFGQAGGSGLACDPGPLALRQPDRKSRR